MRIAPIIFILSSLIGHFAWAGGKVVGNGGSSVALEFAEAARIAILVVTKSSQVYPEVRNLNLSATLESAKIVVSDEKLYSKVGEQIQASTAINKNHPDMIVIQRAAWQLIRDSEIRQALALHEILGLLGVEPTGVYTVSRRYLANAGIKCEEHLCEVIPHYNCAMLEDDGGGKVKVMAAKATGVTGRNAEYVNLQSGKMQALVFLANDKTNLFIVDIYVGDVRVSRWRVDDSPFPKQMSTSWQEKEKIRGDEWTVSCHL